MDDQKRTRDYRDADYSDESAFGENEADALERMRDQATAPLLKSKLVLFVEGIQSQIEPKYLETSFFNLMWIFIVASIVGLLIEDVFHVILYGSWESRAGLVWGPLSPVYGVGALLLTLFLNRLYYSHNVIIFVVAMLIGTGIEYYTSLGMQYLWGAAAWDYTGTIGSIDGRTNLAFGIMWGTLGLVWVRFFLPVFKFAFDHINEKALSARLITAAISLFLAVDITATILALNRDAARARGVPAQTVMDCQLDEVFPTEWMDERFHNMTVYGTPDETTPADISNKPELSSALEG